MLQSLSFFFENKLSEANKGASYIKWECLVNEGNVRDSEKTSNACVKTPELPTLSFQ